jgi:hypothetical protein
VTRRPITEIEAATVKAPRRLYGGFSRMHFDRLAKRYRKGRWRALKGATTTLRVTHVEALAATIAAFLGALQRAEARRRPVNLAPWAAAAWAAAGAVLGAHATR